MGYPPDLILIKNKNISINMLCILNRGYTIRFCLRDFVSQTKSDRVNKKI